MKQALNENSLGNGLTRHPVPLASEHLELSSALWPLVSDRALSWEAEACSFHQRETLTVSRHSHQK